MPATRRNLRFREGYSLTEVVVGIFLLTLVWLAAVNVIVVSRATGSLARHKTQAAYVIQQKIEDLRRQVFSTIASSSATVTIDSMGTPDTTAGDITGTQIVTVTTPNTYYKRVLVELNWRESFFGKSKIVKEYAGTYIANDPQAN